MRYVGTNDDNYRFEHDTEMVGRRGDDYLASWSLGTVSIWGGRGDDELWTPIAFNAFLFGGRGADTIIGSNNGDVIKGGRGRDTIKGEDGDDILFGGKGRDSFIFDFQDTGVDKIKDFKVGKDKIVIHGVDEDPVDDAVVSYDAVDGHLYLDANPNDAAPGSLIARLQTGLAFGDGDWEIA